MSIALKPLDSKEKSPLEDKRAKLLAAALDLFEDPKLFADVRREFEAARG